MQDIRAREVRVQFQQYSCTGQVEFAVQAEVTDTAFILQLGVVRHDTAKTPCEHSYSSTYRASTLSTTVLARGMVQYGTVHCVTLLHVNAV